MLLEAGNPQRAEKHGKALDRIVSAMLSSTRETDVVGWYKDRTTVGVMFTELVVVDKNSFLSTILTRVSATLQDNLTFEQFNQISLSFHFFPDHWDHDNSGRPSNPTLYPDLPARRQWQTFAPDIKRTMDIVGSALALVLCAPLLLIIAAGGQSVIQWPVLFRQQRVGQYGKRFTFLKFRSMHVDNDPSVHREYVTKLIAGEAERQASNGNGEGVYKLTNDQRITRIGAFLRKNQSG